MTQTAYIKIDAAYSETHRHTVTHIQARLDRNKRWRGFFFAPIPLYKGQRITNDEELEKKSSLPSFSSRIFLLALCYYLIIIIIITGFVGWGEEEEKAYFVNKSRECQVSSVSSGTRSVSHKEKKREMLESKRGQETDICRAAAAAAVNSNILN